MQLSYSKSLCCFIICCMFAVCGNAVGADEQKKEKKAAAKKQAVQKAIPTKLTTDQEENALKFAKTHHPELARLLEQLRRKSSVEFKRGIREVHLAALRLDRMKEKQPARFKSELQTWKADSEIRLLSAKWIVSSDKKLEKQIQALLRKRQENRIEKLTTERERLAQRLQQLDDQINMSTSEMEAAIASEWERLSKRAAAARKARSRSSKKSTAAKSKTDETDTKN